MTGTPDEVLRALADPERLAVAGVLAIGDRTAEQLAETCELTVARVRRHLGRLTATGIVAVDADRRTYRLAVDVLREAAREAGPSREGGEYWRTGGPVVLAD